MAVFASGLRFDAKGVPTNARAAEVRAAQYIREYMTGNQWTPTPTGSTISIFTTLSAGRSVSGHCPRKAKTPHEAGFQWWLRPASIR
jgi:hypothetical protein